MAINDDQPGFKASLSYMIAYIEHLKIYQLRDYNCIIPNPHLELTIRRQTQSYHPDRWTVSIITKGYSPRTIYASEQNGYNIYQMLIDAVKALQREIQIESLIHSYL